MRATVFGAAGRTGRRVVTQLLAEDYEVQAVVRRAEQASALTSAGASAVVLDLLTASRDDLRRAVRGASAVIYTAGSAHGSPPHEVDRLDGTAIADAVDAAVQEEVERFVLVSAHRVDDDFGPPEVVRLLRAKRAADAYLRGAPLGWTIVRPDALTEDPASGTVTVGDEVPYGELPRADLAALIVATLTEAGAVRRQFEVVAGDAPISAALQSLSA
jgi:uncharacterized protein YbjT (DUF2867 family)